MRSKKTLASFILFCWKHSDLRFWQALRAWAGVDFIVITNFAPHDFGKPDGWMRDTFYWEARYGDKD